MKNFLLIGLIFIGIVSCNRKLTIKEKENYTAKGKEIAQATFNELSSQLTAKINSGGPSEAIPFCNLEANSLTEQMAEKFNVSIRRTSNQLRSCSNEPSNREAAIISDYEQLLNAGKPIAPIIEIDKNNKKHFYAPIKVQSNCLVCHGKINETLSVSTDSIIKLFYPFDKAIGYSEGDLRGIWSIEFKK
jgi:hypothetical protein